MTLKKLTVIAVAASVMICTSVFVGIHLNTNNEMEFAIGEQQYTINGSTKTFDESVKNLPVIDEKSQKLLIPLRWVIEELKGSVEWDKETKATVIQYQGKNIRIETGNQKAAINGYGVILEPPVVRNGCTYVTADFMADNFDTNIIWDGKQKEITLRTEAIQRPIVYQNKMVYQRGNRSYDVAVPVIIGLNDGNYKKNLNHKLSSDVTDEIHDFMTKHEKDVEKSNLHSEYTIPYRSKEMISIVFSAQTQKNEQTEEQSKKAVNIDLQTQTILKLEDLFRKKDYKQRLAKELSIKELPEQTEFYLDKDRGLVLYYKNEYAVEEYTIPFFEIRKMLKDNYQFLLGQNQP